MYFPLFLKIKYKKFLIVGGGNIALAKLETILEFSNNIFLLAENFDDETLKFATAKKIKIIRDSYHKKYLTDVDIVIAATNDKALNQNIANDTTLVHKIVNSVDDVSNSNFIFGASIKKNDVIISVSTSGVSPVLARLIKQKLNQILPQNFEFLNDFLAQNKEKVKKSLTKIQARRLFWQEVLEGIIAQEVLVGNFKKAQELLDKKLLDSKNQQMGAVYFISAGPGDPELITLKAIKLLSKADVVLYDRLVAKEILDYARKDALKINVGKSRNLHLYQQDEINKMIYEYAKKGLAVARLKGGDAAFFAHLSEEIEAILDLKVPYQVVPGVTAASGAASHIGIPLTSRTSNKSVRFLTIYKENLTDNKFWQELAQSNDTLVLYMSSHNINSITQNLVKFGKDLQTPMALIEQATTKYQKTFIATISEFTKKFKDRKFISPSLIIIGDVVDLNHKYQWLEENYEGNYFEKLGE